MHTMTFCPVVSVVVLTLNAGREWSLCLSRLTGTRFPVKQFLVVDSSSDDDTVSHALECGFECIVTSRREFNHGRTRQLAVEHLADSDLIVFLTQDALIASAEAIGNLIRAFDNETVGVAYGRQLPNPDAGLLGAHARTFNYPDQSELRNLEARQQLGLKAAFVSNSFAAYRRKALLEVGGFPSEVIFGEDMVVAARMLLGGWKVAYQADACVTHSHDYSVVQEFRRYFDIGVLHNREAWLLREFGKPEGEGLRFVKSELAYLSQRNPTLIPSAILRTGFKYLGYRLGRVEGYLPSSIKRSLSMHRNYWVLQ